MDLRKRGLRINRLKQELPKFKTNIDYIMKTTTACFKKTRQNTKPTTTTKEGKEGRWLSRSAYLLNKHEDLAVAHVKELSISGCAVNPVCLGRQIIRIYWLLLSSRHSERTILCKESSRERKDHLYPPHIHLHIQSLSLCHIKQY